LEKTDPTERLHETPLPIVCPESKKRGQGGEAPKSGMKGVQSDGIGQHTGVPLEVRQQALPFFAGGVSRKWKKKPHRGENRSTTESIKEREDKVRTLPRSKTAQRSLNNNLSPLSHRYRLRISRESLRDLDSKCGQNRADTISLGAASGRVLRKAFP